MKVRDFLRGFSVGMIFTCCVLFIVFKGDNQISDEYVIERAKQLNMVFQDEGSSIIMQNTAENGSTTNQNVENQDATGGSFTEGESSDKTTSEPGKDDSSDSSDNTYENQKGKDNDSENEKSTVETVTINISKGMTSADVSDILYDLNIIEDKKEFGLYLHNNGYSLKVKIGEFEIPIGASYEEIAKIITKS